MATTPAAGQAAAEGTSTRYPGWLAVPHGLRTVAQWRREGRTVQARCKKRPMGVVDWDGRAVKVFSEDQTTPYKPRPETVAFRQDREAFTAFLNPRRERYAFKARRDWECRDWPQTPGHLSDDILEQAFSHREGVAILPAAAGGFRYYVIDTDFHDPACDPERFLAQVSAVHDALTAEGDDFFMACREGAITGLHFWAFGDEELPLGIVLREASRVKAALIARHSDLFDEKLEIYPDPVRPCRLPIFPGRCPILDVPLEGLPPRQQLARLVKWIDNPGRPMAKDDLLAWVRARLPRTATVREGGCQLLIADSATCPAPWHDVLRRELRRLKRHRTCRHGPPGWRRVA